MSWLISATEWNDLQYIQILFYFIVSYFNDVCFYTMMGGLISSFLSGIVYDWQKKVYKSEYQLWISEPLKLNTLDTWKKCRDWYSIIWKCFYHSVKHPKSVDRIANSIDPDQTAAEG